MKIIATSDIHGDLPDPTTLPPGDVLIIAGDILPDDFKFAWSAVIGSTRIERQGWWFQHVFVPWLNEAKYIIPADKKGVWPRRYKHIVLVPGNHDFFFQAMMISGIQKHLPTDVHYLSETSVILDMKRFYGAGWNMTKGWAFAMQEDGFAEKLEYVPNDIDVMVVHGPPFIKEINDLRAHFVSRKLSDWIVAHPAKAFICGHIHEAYGTYTLGTTPVHVVSRKNRDYEDVNDFVEITI